MKSWRERWAWAVALAALALPAVLLVNSVVLLRNLEKIRTGYLRLEAGRLAARIVELAPGTAPGWEQALLEEEPGLADLAIFGPGSGTGDATLQSMLAGQKLFHAEEVRAARPVYRVYVPLAAEDGMKVARFDLSTEAADALTAGARKNLLGTSVMALALVGLLGYALRARRRHLRLEAERVRLEHLAHIGTMGAVLAHEIRNPLGTIKGFVQLAREGAGERTAALLDPVLEETGRLERLVRDLLSYARPPAPKLRPVKWEEVRTRLEWMRGEAESREAELQVAEEGPDLRADLDVLEQILVNLVRNSCEAVGKGGTVRVEAGGDMVRVSDDGPGFAPEVLRRQFEPFFTTKAFGTGLGLATAQKLARSLGAELTIGNHAPQGACVEVRWKRK